MPSATARRYFEDQIPSFMSVFDLDAETMADRETVTVVDPKLVTVEPGCAPLSGPPTFVQQQVLRPGAMPSDAIHKHHGSTSTQASESADSSPTTTLSTADSSPLSDPSPSSSPDSPANLIPLSSYPGPSFGCLPSTLSSLTVTDYPNADSRPMTSPSPRRARNMKGLSIQPPTIASSLAEPASPSTTFIKPIVPPMRKRPSQLSLQTNTSDLVMRNTTLNVPSSPALPPILQRRALKHSASTPHMLTGLKSSTFGPAGGMGFPKVLERNENGLSEILRPSRLNIGQSLNCTITEEASPIRTQVANRGAIDMMGLRDESENNEDQKSPGYPDGPIAIYDDNVFLYLEPTADEAAKFDLVINVAREVRNPFSPLSETTQDKPEPEQPSPADDSPIPDTALTDASFRTAFEYPPPTHPDELMGETTPTTPKALFPSKQPEYIHMLWDHNTDISPDLLSLCEKVEETTKEGKKVLIHCQQGASRSASLIIAYGLFRNPELSVNDAYYAAQAKSRWISPNMRLMYCLQDFQKEISKKKSNPGSALRQRSGRSPTKHRLTLSADGIDISSSSTTSPPLTAPLYGEDEESRGRTPGSRSSANHQRGNSTPASSKPISPGPSSAPSSFSWEDPDTQNDPGKLGRFNLSDIKLPPAPPREEPVFKRIAPPTRAPPPPPPPKMTFDLGLKPMDISRPPPTPAFPPRSFESHGSFGFSGFSFQPQPTYAPPPPPSPPRNDEPKERRITLKRSFVDDSALMSPRVETMMNNPLRDPSPVPEVAGMSFAEPPPAPAPTDPAGGLFSPRATSFPRDLFSIFARPPPAVADPRSPPTKGEAPIVRSIDELL
ncbi:related to dual-specificity MAP kinase phosphatase [Cephalotrichum gorgonifer]|uniref:protein-tyrosine-phosphatase n=1 Tax=Cephalotrichum gorgonifer TaxID=2041049 RepID=A0AAE8MUY7_9PEZI|nr:related to dual-specificity MAP kinase phosphatase [Cephalotrichum gorgonifer]